MKNVPDRFVVSLHCTMKDYSESFGVLLEKVVGMPESLEFPERSQMAKYGRINIKFKDRKALKAEAAPKAAPAPVAVVNEADVQGLLATPGIADILKQLMAASGGAAVLPPVETPTIKAARGRPSTKK
jgi:hypothetical protein